MTPSDDTALLDTLGAALAPSPVAPGADEIATLRMLVEQGAAREVVAFPVAVRPRRPVAHAALVAAVVVALVVVGGALAFTVGAPVPSALRAPARALGFSVDSSGTTGATALTETRHAMDTLRSALDGADDARVVTARDVLVARLGKLSAAHRARVEPEASALLTRADARLRAVGEVATPPVPTEAGPTSSGGAGEGGATEPVPGASATAPEAPDDAVTGDDPTSAPTATTEPAEPEPEAEAPELPGP